MSIRKMWPIIIFTVVMVYPTFLFSQAKVSLVPGIGRQAIQAYVKESMYADKTFKAYNLAASPSFNINLQLDIKSNWLIHLGCNVSRSVISYKYGETGINRISFSKLQAINFPIGIQKWISTHRWLKINREKNLLHKIFGFEPSLSDNRYLLLFRSKLLAGVTYDNAKNIIGNINTPYRTNTSLFFGIGLQFFDDLKDRLQLNLFYSQGLKEISVLDIDYLFNGKSYKAKIGSRGSLFSIQIAYPIRIINFSR